MIQNNSQFTIYNPTPHLAPLPQGERGLLYPFRFSLSERRVFEKKEPLTISQWAEKYRIVPIGAHKGPWRNDISPHLVKIMDTWGLPYVREIIVCKSPQTGGTEVMNNCSAFAMDRHPANMMFVMPSEATAKKVSADRLIPMLEQSPKLRKLMASNPDDTAKLRVKLNNGVIIYMAHSNSAAALATFPIKYLFFDETDKYPPFVGKESDPITLGEKRARTFRHTYKLFKVSTPTREDAPIWKAWTQADVQYKYHVPCLHCGTVQIMTIDNLKWPEGSTAEDIRRETLAWYECPHCKAQWTDIIKEKAVRSGEWEKEKGKAITKPRSVAFHLPSWVSPDISLSEIASAYIITKTDKAKLIDFFNDYLAEPFVDVQVDRKEEIILALKDERPRGLVPKGISCLTAAVDTQQRGFYYEVRAWGYGAELESWQVREGFVETFDGLHRILFEDEYKDTGGNKYIIQIALIDSGGGATDYGSSRTAEVYDFCRRFPGVYPVKGMQRMNQPYRVSQIDNYPGTNKAIPGGLKLYILNTTYFKDQLARKLEINPADPGAWHLHSEVTEEYARQMCVEYSDKGLWRCPKNKPNHFWDCSVYGLATAEIIGIKFWKKSTGEGSSKPVPTKEIKKQKTKNRRW